MTLFRKRHLYSGLSIEWFSGWLLLAWGLFLMLPFDSFHSTSHYKIMAQVASEWNWGVLAVVCALFHFTSLRANRCAFGYEGRWISLWMQLAWWLMLTCLSARGNIYGHGWVMYGSLSIALIYSMIRLKRSATNDPERKRRDRESHQAQGGLAA